MIILVQNYAFPLSFIYSIYCNDLHSLIQDKLSDIKSKKLE